MEQTSNARQWASAQAARYPSSPLPTQKFNDGFIHALETIVYGLMSRDSPNTPSEQFSFYHFADDVFDLWAGFNTALRFLPVQFLKANNRCKIDVRKVVFGHLSDTDIRKCVAISVMNV
jgi:senataxin